MLRLRFAVLVTSLVAIAGPVARAQQPDTLTAVERAGLALSRLGAYVEVRARARGHKRVQGQVESSSPTLLTIRTADRETVEIPASDLDSLWVRVGTYRWKGALVGAGVLGLTLGVSGATGGSDCCGSRAGAAFLGLVAGGVAGALWGAMFGDKVPKLQRKLP